MELDQNFVKEVKESLSLLFPRARCRRSYRQSLSIVIQGAKENEEFQFIFYLDRAWLQFAFLVDDTAVNILSRSITGKTPQEVAKQIIEAIKVMPLTRHRYLTEEEEQVLLAKERQQQQELAAAA